MITKCSQRPVQKGNSQGDHCKNCTVSDTWFCIGAFSMPEMVLIAIFDDHFQAVKLPMNLYLPSVRSFVASEGLHGSLI